MPTNSKLYRQSAWQALSLQQHGQVLLTPNFKAWIICLGLMLWIFAIIVVVSTHSFTEKATVIGYISTEQPSISISPKESVGVIAQVYVQNGQWVEQGQRLLSVERPSRLILGEKGAALQVALLDQHLKLLQDNFTQLKDENSQQQAFISQQLVSAGNQQQAITQQVFYLNQRIAMTDNDIERLQGLFAKQLISRDSLSNAKQNLLSMRQQLAQFTLQLSDNNIAQTQLKAQHAKLRQQVQLQSTQTALNLLPVKQQISDLQTQQTYTIYATRSGLINNLHAQAGDDIGRFSVLMKLSDTEQPMQLQLAVPASAAGFIKTAQSVRIRLDAFPHQKYGTLNATVSKVANTITLPNESHAHAIQLQGAVFMVEAQLEQSYVLAKGEKIPLKEGMTVQADVVLSERSLLEWLLSPLYSLRGSL